MRNRTDLKVLPPWRERCTPIPEAEGLVTCEHLFPIEAAMRAAGIRLRHTAGGSPRVALCECWFHEESLRRHFPLPTVVRFLAYGDHFGDGQQSIECTACRSAICVFDPAMKTQRFPAES
ncbi:MAG TPA: hypothetical protein VKU19_04775 [Bryobacteraceae bacterium]|nr:hypothetical protein [Bryobacteraceae bacterium]